MIGARSADRSQRVEGLIRTFERRRRLVTPTHRTWKRASRVIQRLAEARQVDAGTLTRAFTCDALIAVSCREAGATLVTENVRDFTRIQGVLGFQFRERGAD